MKIYRIQHIETGLFSTGGQTPAWKTSGKVWRTKGQANAAIAGCVKYYTNMCFRYSVSHTDYKKLLLDINNWSIVSYNVTPNEYIGVDFVDSLTEEAMKSRIDEVFLLKKISINYIT